MSKLIYIYIVCVCAWVHGDGGMTDCECGHSRLLGKLCVCVWRTDMMMAVCNSALQLPFRLRR